MHVIPARHRTRLENLMLITWAICRQLVPRLFLHFDILFKGGQSAFNKCLLQGGGGQAFCHLEAEVAFRWVIPSDSSITSWHSLGAVFQLLMWG